MFRSVLSPGRLACSPRPAEALQKSIASYLAVFIRASFGSRWLLAPVPLLGL